MIHQFRDKRQIVRQKKITQNVIGLIAFFILIASGIFMSSRGFFNYIGLPVWKANGFISRSIENISYLVYQKSSLLSDNQRLSKENEDLKNSMIDYQIVKNENDQLKELFGRVPLKSDFVLGNILTKPNHSPYDTIIVDIGSDSNITEGNKVYADAKIPIGEVSKVYKNTSLVVLYSNPGQTTEANIDGSNVSVELVGRGGGNFEMMIPIDLPSIKGTMIVLPGAELEVVALIEEVISASTDSVKKVILRSPVNIQNLKWVQIKKGL